MGAEYQLRIVDTAGNTQAVITDFLQLAFTRVVNEPGLITFVLRDGHPAIQYATFNNQVEIWRRNLSIGLDFGSSPEFVGIIRAIRWETSESTRVIITAPGVMSILGWRHVAYRAGTLGRSLFNSAKAESIMKSIVAYNCTSSGATADGRVRDATSSGKVSGLYTITVQNDGAAGNTISRGVAWDNVLSALKNIQLYSGGDFDLVKTGSSTFDFRWYTGQRGTDRTSTLLFALERGNMVSPVFEDNRIDERTVVIVGGKGEEQQRQITVVNGPDRIASSRDFETFIDATNADTSADRTSAGQITSYDVRAAPKFTFGALQAPNAYYGVHYFLGDKVTALYKGLSYTQKVRAVSIQFDDSSGESIDVEFENV